MRKKIVGSCAPVCATLIAIAGYMAVAGDLNPPPGPIAPTMKTLTEIEPRIAINAANTPGDADSVFRIASPGSYYLAGNVAGLSGESGIEIAAADVTIDLMGHSLVGAGGSLGGIVTSGGSVARVVIRNGIVRGWGEDGIDINVANCEVSDVIATNNGLVGVGAGEGSRVRDCTARQNGSHGLQVRTGGIIQNCVSRQNTGDGIFGGGPNSDITILDCESSSNTGDGIEVNLRCQVRGNHCGQNGFAAGDGAGIHVGGNNNRIEANTLIGADRGLDIDASDNYVADNVVRGNTDNYDMVAGNQLNILLGQIPESIDWPASVKLAGSLTGVSGQNGITVMVSGVTIDLNGHALTGVSGALVGIATVDSTLANTSVRNGIVRLWGSHGLNLGRRSLIENINAEENGGAGIQTSAHSVVKGCTSSQNLGVDGASGVGGIYANTSTVIECTASNNSGIGIGVIAGNLSGSVSIENAEGGILCSAGMVTDCTALGNGLFGITASAGAIIQGCSVRSSTGDGIVVNRSVVMGCISSSNSVNGIRVEYASSIIGNTCDEHTGVNSAGIFCTNFPNRIEENNCTGNTKGFDIDGGANLIFKNTAGNNAINFEIAAGNFVGPILPPTMNAAPISGNNYSGGIGTNNPWANFAN